MLQEDSRREREPERKRSREDRAPAENGHTRKRRTAEEAAEPCEAGKRSEKWPRDDSRESSHERWVAGASAAEAVDVNDRWAG